MHQWLGSRKTSHPYTKRHTGQELCLAVNPSGTAQNMKVVVMNWSKVSCLFRLSFHNMKVVVMNRSKVNCLFRLSFHMIGKEVCLVMLWPNPARRDKPWNYIPPEFQRYTKLVLATRYLYGHVENVWGIPFPKRIMQKYRSLGELFPEQGFWLQIDYMSSTCW